MRRRNLAIRAALAAACFVVVPIAAAAPISYSTGFEQPAFNVGDNVPAVGTLSGWFRQDGTPTTTALPDVDISPVNNGGSQGLRILNLAPYNQLDPGSVTYAISPVYTLPGAANVVANGTPFVHVQWDMRVDDPADHDINKTSDTWCLDVYDSTANVRTLSVARGTVPLGNELTPTVYATGATGQFTPTEIGAGPASGAWGTFELDLDYLSRTFDVSLNGVVLAFDLPMNVAADNGIDLNFTVNGRGIDVAYFDNFLVTAVPEPGTLGVAALCMVTLLSRRRGRGR